MKRCIASLLALLLAVQMFPISSGAPGGGGSAATARSTQAISPPLLGMFGQSYSRAGAAALAREGALWASRAFISDVHLGTVWSHAEHVLDFLLHLKSPFLLINGDLLDIEAIEGRIRYWLIRPRFPWLALAFLGFTSSGVGALFGFFPTGVAMLIISLTALLGFWNGMSRWSLVLIVPSLIFSTPLFIGIALLWRYLSWQPRGEFHMAEAHEAVLQEIVERPRSGTRVILIPGNHDAWYRSFIGKPPQDIATAMTQLRNEAAQLNRQITTVKSTRAKRELIGRYAYVKARLIAGEWLERMLDAGVELHHHFVDTLMDGTPFHARHGDEDDGIGRDAQAQQVYRVGSRAYDAALVTNYLIGLVRRHFNLPHFAFSQLAKNAVKAAVNHMHHFARSAALAALEESPQARVLVVGHIHKAEIKPLQNILPDQDILYVNTGDWVEWPSALIEEGSGGPQNLRLLHWPQLLSPDIADPRSNLPWISPTLSRWIIAITLAAFLGGVMVDYHLLHATVASQPVWEIPSFMGLGLLSGAAGSLIAQVRRLSKNSQTTFDWGSMNKLILLNVLYSALVESLLYHTLLPQFPGISGMLPIELQQTIFDALLISPFLTEPLAFFAYSRYLARKSQSEALQEITEVMLGFYVKYGWVWMSAVLLAMMTAGNPIISFSFVQAGVLAWNVFFEEENYPKSEELLEQIVRHRFLGRIKPLLWVLQTWQSYYRWPHVGRLMSSAIVALYAASGAHWLYQAGVSAPAIVCVALTTTIFRLLWLNRYRIQRALPHLWTGFRSARASA